MKNETELYINLQYSDYKLVDIKTLSYIIDSEGYSDYEENFIIEYLIHNENVKFSQIVELLFFKPINAKSDAIANINLGNISKDLNGVKTISSAIDEMIHSFDLIVVVILENSEFVIKHNTLSKDIEILFKI